MKYIIPAAGLGTRFLPITAAIPKEMLPLGNQPALEIILQEARENNCSAIGLIISPAKELIKEYCQQKLFTPFLPAHEKRLHDSLQLLQSMKFSFFYQHKPAGLANALLHAQEYIGQDPWFAVALPDDIIDPSDFAAMKEISHKHQASVIAVQEVCFDDIEKYGIAKIKHQIDENTFEIESFVEKPKKEFAPSRLAIVGRYIFSQKLFSYIEKTSPTNGEILLPESINLMMQAQEKVIAYKLAKPRFDIGTPQGWYAYIQKLTEIS